MKRIFTAILPIILILGCQPNEDTQTNQIVPSQDEAFKNYSKTFLNKLWEINPGWASSLGLHDYDGIIIIPNEENKLQTKQAYQVLLDSLNTFNLDNLSKSNATDYYLIKNHLESSNWYSSEFKSGDWNPSNYNLAGSVARLLNGSYEPLSARLKKIENALNKSKEYYTQATSNISNPSIPHTELAITQLKGSVDIFQSRLIDSIAVSSLTENEKSELTTKTESTIIDIQTYLAYLEELKKEYTTTKLGFDNAASFRVGKEKYFKKFDYDIESNSSAEEIFQKALKRKAELHQQMIANADTLWSKYLDTDKPEDKLKMVQMLIQEISKSHTSRDEFIPTIKKQLPELVKFVNDNDLLTQNPEKPLVVRATPLYMRGGGAGASVNAPGPFDRFANTYYNVTPLDNYTEEEAESYLREYNDYVLQVLNIHEAIPGHYIQLVYSNESPSLIKSILGNGAMIEGWAVYSELMMLEEGYNNSPEMWLMYSKWHLRVVCNTILDYSVHVLDMSEEDAKNLLINEAFQEQAEANGKWTRAKLTSVQLCSYFTGFSEIYDLRDEVKFIKGDDFDLKEFHEEFLSYGSAPVKYIREMMLNSLNKKD